MSYSEIKLTCPECGHEHLYTVWRRINIKDFPYLRESVLKRKTNGLRCSHCGTELYGASRYFMYNDENNVFAIMYVPLDKKENFKALRSYIDLPYDKLRIVYDYDSLIEKILIFENGLNDKAIEICKSNIMLFNAEMLPDNGKMFFTEVIDDKIVFSYNKISLPDNSYYDYAIPIEGYSSTLLSTAYDTGR